MGGFASLRALKKPEKQQLGSGTDRQMLPMNKGRKLSSGLILPIGRQILLLFPPFTLVENSETRQRLYGVCLSAHCGGVVVVG